MNITAPRRAMLQKLLGRECLHTSDLGGRSVDRYRVLRALHSAGLVKRSGHVLEYVSITPAGVEALGAGQAPAKEG